MERNKITIRFITFCVCVRVGHELGLSQMITRQIITTDVHVRTFPASVIKQFQSHLHTSTAYYYSIKTNRNYTVYVTHYY